MNKNILKNGQMIQNNIRRDLSVFIDILIFSYV